MQTVIAGSAIDAAKKTSVHPTTDVLAVAQERFEDLIRCGALKAAERFVAYAPDREDRIGEGLAHAWRWYRDQFLQGRVPDLALVRHVVNLRTADRRRRFVSGDRSRWQDDVYNRQGRDIELRRLDTVFDDDGDERREDRSLGLARLGVQDPTTNLVSEMDLTRWLETLPTTDREMVELRGAGFALGEIGRATGRSVAGVHRRVRQLGEQLALRAGVSVRMDGEMSCPAG